MNDGKPGHMTQTSGLVNYLKKHFFVEDQILSIKPKIKIVNRLFRITLNNNSRYAESLFGFFYKFNKAQVIASEPDMIISTGGDTCGANAFLAKQYNCKNLYLGSLRGHDPNLFSKVISTTEMPGVDNSIILEVAPTLIDPKNLKNVAKTFLDEQKNRIPEKFDKMLWVMLIGGDGSGYSFTKQDYEHLVAGMADIARQYNIRWLVTTSRRTGLSCEQFLRSLINELDDVAYAVYFNNNPEKVMQAYLGAGEMIFCTEDSTSMVSEAVISGKPVFTLRGSTSDINRGHLAVIKRFSKQRYICRIKINELAALSPEKIKHERIDIYKNYDQILDIASESNSN